MSKVQFIEVTPQQLQEEILNGIKTFLSEFSSSSSSQTTQPDEYLTRQETADFFKVDLSTLWHWKNRGFLIPYGAEGIVRYKRSEIEQAMVKLK